MKIAVAAKGEGLSAVVEPVLGRADYFVIVDYPDMHYQSFPNPYAEHQKNIGVSVAQFLIDKGVQSVLSGDCGKNAALKLRGEGVHVGIGYKGSVREVVAQFAKTMAP